MDINGKKISKQKRPNSPPCQFIRGYITKYLSGDPIFDPYYKMNCLPPQGLRWSHVVQYGTNSFKELVIQQLCDAIMLGGVVSGEALLCALWLQKVCEVINSVFTTMVRPKMFDLDLVLCLHPWCKCFVCFESLIFAVQEF